MAENKSTDIQRKYNAASVLCNTLDTVVPAAMSFEQTKFNEKLIATVGDVDKYVADKLKYKTVDELCDHFGKEQIDAIATAIYQHEYTGDSIIVADQTGVGKGRVAAGLIRYSILGLGKIPIFFTEKAHLISDIYRDLINIGLDMGVPEKLRKVTKTKGKEYKREEIIDLIFADLKDDDELQVDYDFEDEEIKDKTKYLKDDDNEAILEEIIELYEQMLLETGGEQSKVSYEKNPNYQKDSIAAAKDGKIKVKPLLLNPIKVKDIEGNILYEPSKKQQDEIFKTQKIPSEYKLIATAYSQISSPYETDKKTKKKVMKAKVKTLWKYSKDSVLILDESHNASGMKPDGTKSNTAEIMFSLVKNSSMTTFLSATYAKRADNMPLYALTTAIREAGLSEKDLIGAFLKGGNALQEATSAELVRNGELLRREKAISGKTVYEYMDESSDAGLNQINKLDLIASLFKQVREFEGEMAQKFTALANMMGIEKGTVKFAGRTGRFAFLLFNFFILGLKVRQTADEAIKKLKEGKKPIIAIGNTMESAFDKMQKTFKLNAPASDYYKTGEAIPNDFKLYCAYLLKYTFRAKIEAVIVDDQGNKDTKTSVFDLSTKEGVKDCNAAVESASGVNGFATELVEAMEGKYREELAKIMQVTTGIALSPIDMIIHRIEKAGFSVEEITGRKRQLSIVENNDYYEYIISDRVIRKTEDIVRDYNQNKVDALLINQAGATGLSMHALPNDVATKVPETPPISLDPRDEVKQRAMIVTQMELDINKEVQKLGRINRTGQVYPPEYTYLISAIPSESRLTSMMEKKLRSLSANVSSNQTQFSYQFTADDFFSDIAVAPCNAVLRAMGRTDLAGSKREVTNGKDIYNLTKQLYFADYFTQKDFYTNFSKALADEINSLRSQGLYTGVMENKDYAAKSMNVYPFFIGNNEARTSFGRHVFIDKSEVQIIDQKNIEQFVKEKVKSSLTISPVNSTDTLVFNTKEDYIKKSTEFLDKYDVLYQQAQEKNDKETEESRKEYQGQIDELDKKLKDFGILDELVKMKEEATRLKNEKQEIVEEIAKILSSGAADAITVVQEKTAKVGELQVDIDELTKKIDSPKYQEAYEKRNEYDRVNRDKKDVIWQLERLERGYESTSEKIAEKRRVIELIREYINKIGHILEYSAYDENYDYDSDLEKYQYTYNKVTDENVVLYGVSWAAYEDPESVSQFGGSLTLGSVTLKLAKVVGTETLNLFAFLSPIKEQHREEGRQHKFQIKDTGKQYEGVWNRYLSSIDTGRMEERYFLTGSLLKGFVAGYQNGYSGTIVKYNTSENKVRIGIELSDEARKALQDRYNEETALSYPIFFDANPENTKLFVKDYLWYAYNAEKGEGKPNDRVHRIKGLLSSAGKGKIVFEVTASGTSRVAVAFGIPEVTNQYSVGEVETEPQKMFDRLTATFMFSKGTNAAGFLTLAKNIAQSRGMSTENIDAIRDEDAGTKGMEDFRSSWDVKSSYAVSSYYTPFSDFFPTDLIKFQEKASDAGWGSTIYEFAYVVKIPFALFEAITEYLAEERKNLIMCTSSAWYEQSDANFVMEQFDDDIQVPEAIDGGEEVEFESPLTDEVKERVDNLINDLLTTVSDGITEYV